MIQFISPIVIVKGKFYYTESTKYAAMVQKAVGVLNGTFNSLLRRDIFFTDTRPKAGLFSVHASASGGTTSALT